jgi:hypothetical protein
MLFFLLVFSVVAFGQMDFENSCIQRIKRASESIKFPPANPPVKIMGDTLDFTRGMIVITNSSLECRQIVINGIIFPNLVMSASTSVNGNFVNPPIDVIETIHINSFERISESKTTSGVRTYSFLIYRKGLANPYQYILQLINDKAEVNTKMTDVEFINGARILTFGFCTILI